MHQLEIIENDLKQLQAETKKKHGPLKESLSNSLIVFQSYKNSQDRDNSSSFPIGEIMRSIEMIPATKNEKIIVPALNMFKNMLNYGYLKDKYLLSVLNFLGTSLEIPDDNIQVKLLQTILLFVTPNHLDFNKFELIEKLFNLTLQMYNSKNIIIHNTASAALFQLSSIIFERFALYIKVNKIPTNAPKEEEKSDLDPSFYQKSIKLLREFIMIINGLRPDWSPQNVSIPRNTGILNKLSPEITSLGLDILNSILKQVGPTLKHSKEAHQLIKKELIPVLSNCFEPKTNDFPALVRIGRATSRIILSLHDGIELIDHLISLLNHSEIDFEKYLCVETLTLVVSSTDIMKMFNERHISTISYYMEILNSFLRLSKEVTEDPDFDRRRYAPLNSKLQKILDSNLTEYETPQITTTHIYKALTDFFVSATESFVFLSERCEFKLGVVDNIATKHEQKNFVEWLTSIWKPTLKCLKYLLPKQVDESMTQSLLNAFQKMISLTGSLGLTQARDSYIITLCQNCLPYDDHSLRELTLKNIQATKTVFNIAHCLGAILDINSWHSIFMTLQKTEILFDRIRTQITPFLAQNAAPNRLSLNKTEQDKDAVKRLITQEDENSLLLDLQILSAALDSLFTQSSYYPIEHFKCFMEALNQLCLEYMEKVTTSETLVIEGVTIDGKSKIFGLSRMLETILVNLDRIESCWDLIMAHYVCIASNSKNVILRNRGVENLNTLTEKAFQYFMHKKAKGPPSPQNDEKNGDETEESIKKKKTSDLWTRENWQKTLFQPWLEISKTKFPDVKENICQALLRLLQNNGHEITQEGWIVISNILQELSHDSMGSAVHIGFRCLEMIINDYLQEIGLDSVKILINVTENFKKISSDNNMSYQSVGMFWKIGDYLAKVQDQEQKKGKEGMDGFDEAWILILNRLASFASDEHSELRTSAIHTLTNLMVHHGFILGMPLWNRVLNDLIFKLVDEVFEVYMTLTRVEAIPQASNLPKFGSGSKVDSKDLANKEEKNKNLKQWEDTLTILMQNLLKIVKKYISVIEKIPDLNKSSPEIVILKNVLIKVKGFIMVARNELIAESIKLLHEIMLTKPEILSIMIDTVFDALSIVRTFLIENRQDGKEIKTIISKFIPEVLEILGEIFSPQRYAILNPQKIPYSKNLFDILEKAIFYSKQAETFNSISLNTKIITDVKPVYDFIEKIPTTLCENNDEMVKQYFEFIIHVLSLPVSDKFTDLVIRKFVAILENVINGRLFAEAVYFPYLPTIFEKLRSLLCLRCNNEFLTLMVNTSKNTLPIWLHVTDSFHNIAGHVLECYSTNAKKAESGSEDVTKEVIEKSKQLTYQIVEIYEVVLKSAEKSFDNISKSLLIEIKKNWFEMDMKFINSIGNTLVPNFTLMDPELLWRLIHILDFTFSFYSKNPMFVEQTGAYNATYGRDPAASSTISKITLEILFKISEGYQDHQDQSDLSEEIQKRINLSKLATKKLIFKCKRILNRYVYDEKRSGNMPLPKNRLLEICYILEKLTKLHIPKDSFIVRQTDDLNPTLEKPIENFSCIIAPEDEEEEGLGNGSLLNLQSGASKLEEIALIPINSHPDLDAKILNSSKGHLIYLMPLFSECITCREPEIKDHLRKIFLEISKGLGVLTF